MKANCSNHLKSERKNRIFFANKLRCLVFGLLGSIISWNASAQTQQIYTTPGTGTSTAIPAGINVVTAQTWGGGGAGGGSVTNKRSGAGGGGGGYTLNNSLSVTPGSTYNYTVGNGGAGILGGKGDDGTASSFNSICIGNPGLGGNIDGGAGGTGGAGTYAGGTGAAGFISGSAAGGSGGGSSAGISTAGLIGTLATTTTGAAGGIAPTGGGNGGTGGAAGATGINGTTPGGGGGGAGDKSGGSSTTGGNGASGKVVISYFILTGTSSTSTCPTNSANITVTGTAANLPVGSYTVTYDLGSPNASSGNTATMTVSVAGTGDFTTVALANGGTTTITITSISATINSVAYKTGYDNTGNGNNKASITVSASLGGTANTNQSICANNTPSDITLSGNIGSIQWQVSTDNFSSSITDVAGATTSTLSGGQMGTLSATRYYRAKVTNGSCAAVYSNTVTITVNAAPSVSSQPSTTPQTVCVNGAITALSVTASAGGSATINDYKWYSNTSNTNSGGSLVATHSSVATTDTYTPSSASSSALYYYCVISNSNSCATTSSASGLITVNDLPSISSHPSASSQNVCINGSVNALSVTASAGGSATISTYQWYSNTANSNSGGTLVATHTSAVTSDAYTPSNAGATALYYYCIVTNSNNCTATSNVSGLITINGLPVVSITGSTAICAGNTTTLSPTTGGTWASNSSSIASVTNGGVVTGLLAGSSTFTFTNTSTTCNNTTPAITINDVPTITLGLSPTICGGTTTANLPFISTTGNPDQYSVVWSGSPVGFSNIANVALTTSPIALTIPSGAAAATYSATLTVRNSTSGCISTTYSFSVTVKRPALTPTTTQPSCFSDGSISLSLTGGTSPYTYDWTDMSGTSNPKDRTGLLPGIYSVTATDASGCVTSSGTLTLNSPTCTGITVCKSDAAQVMSVPPDPDNTSYTWTVPTGAVIVSGQGTPSVTINWTGVVVGAYAVEVVGVNSCGTSSVSSRPVYVTAPTASITYDPACIGGNLQLYASGGVNYTWSGPNGFTSQSSNPVIYNVAAGNDGIYNVTVTNNNGCTATSSQNITLNTGPTITSSITASACGLSTGAVDITPSGGSSFTYLWSTGATTQDISSLSAGSYTVAVTNNLGCTSSQTYSLQNSGAPTITLSSADVTCHGAGDGSITVSSVTGGTALYNSYLWSNASTSNTGISALAPGTYSLVVTDNAGCQGNASVTINQPNTLLADGIITHINCFGASTGAVTLTGSGGTLPYSYSWNGPSFTSNSQNISSRPAGTYSLTLTDNHSCTFNSSFAITQPAATLAATPNISNVSCNGGSDGQITLAVSGGSAPYTYSWTASDGGAIPLGQVNYQNLSALKAGTYNLTITDSKGCTLTPAAFSVTEPSSISLSNTKVDVGCYGSSIGSINLSASGGTGALSYAWSNGATSEDLTGLISGTYIVTVTDGSGCNATRSITINQPIATLSGSAVPTAASCNGVSTGNITLSASGGTPGYTYLWSDASTDQNLTNVPAGFYSVTITDSKSCTAVANATVGEPSILNVSGLVTNVKCHNGATGAIDVSVSGGTAGYTYSWAASNGGSVPGAQATNQDLTGIIAGTYSVTVTDAHSCTKVLSFNVTQPTAALSLSVSQTNISCNGNNDGSINLTASGGTTPYNYLWSNLATSKDISGLINASYSVIVTDANLCTANTSATITQPSILKADADSLDVGCHGGNSGSINLTVTGGNPSYSYLWNTGSTDQNPVGLEAGVYFATITDNKGCTATAFTTVLEPDELIVTPSITDVKCFGGSTGAINLSVSGGTPSYIYAWTGGISTQNRTGLATGSYTVTVSDNHSCSSSVTVIVGTASALAVNVSTTDRICLTANGSAIAQVSGGTVPYSYNWSSGGATTRSITGLDQGSYTVTVTDANLCEANASGSVSKPACELPVVINDSYTTAFNTAIINGSVTDNDPVPTGGLLSFTALTNPTAAEGTIEWDESNDGTFTYTPKAGYSGTFSLNYRATYPNGMYTDGTLTITVVPLPTTAVNGSEQTICVSATATLSGNTPAVGTGTWSVSEGPSTSATQFSDIHNPAAIFAPAGGAGIYLLNWTISNAPNTPSSAYATITVDPLSVGGTATVASSTICNGSSASLSLSGFTGNIQWQQSANGTTGWADVTDGTGATTSSYTTAGITSTTYYRAVVTSGSCSSSYSNVIAVNVNALTPAPAGNASQLFCNTSNPHVSDIAVTGSGVLWYTLSGGGSLIDPATALVDGTTYYASQTLNGCESPSRFGVAVSIPATIPAPIGNATQTFCSAANAKISDLVVTGSGIIWYDAAGGGSVVANTTPLINNTTYYASQTISGCESPLRLAVKAVVNATPGAPGGLASQSFCDSGNPEISNISVTGSNVAWYDAASGGNLLAANTPLADNTNYYATQTVNGCESTSRLAVTITVNINPSAPTGLADQSFCSAGNPKVSNIIVTGSNIIWYNASSAGSVVNSATSLVDGTTYYASQTINGCESTSRLAVLVHVAASIPAPTGTATQSFCSAANPAISNLQVTGTNILWYYALSGGSPIATNTPLVDNTTYYASQSSGSCESTSRLAVLAVVNTTPAAPTGLASQSFCSSGNPKVSNLAATGSNLAWYDAASGGSLLDANTALVSGSVYYASQTVSGCESTTRLAVTVLVNTTPSAPAGLATQSFCSDAGPLVSDISYTGSNVVWFDAATAGNVVAGNTSLVNNTIYYASQTVSGCVSDSRLAITVNVNTNPSAPTGAASQSFCSVDNPQISDIDYTGTNVMWYNTSSAGSIVPGNTSLVNNTTYYASQTVTGCESATRLAVLVAVHNAPAAPTGSATQSFCSAASPVVSNISYTGSNVIWYDAASGGSIVAGNSPLVDNTTYYASQTVNGCEPTLRLAVKVFVNTTPSAPTGLATQSFCSGANPLVSDISLSGTNVVWYDALNAGNVVPASDPLTDGNTYYASQMVNGCVSDSRLAVSVTVNTIPAAPTGVASQSFCSVSNPVISNIVVTGSNLVWHDAPVGGNAFASSDNLSDGTTYYASQTMNGCESGSRLGVTITVNTTPSAPTGLASQTFCNGNSPKVSDIVVTGTNLIWYDAAIGGNLVNETDPLSNGLTYYASQKVNGCESVNRMAVTVTILTCSGPNIANHTLSLDENTANGTTGYDVNDVNTSADKDVDNNLLTYSIVSGNASGAFAIDPATGIITIADASKLDYETIASFVLVVRASNGTITDDGTITINLNNLNDNAPVAVSDSYAVNEIGTLLISAPGILANDDDADGDALTAVKVTDPAHGTLTLNGDGSFTYVHDGSETVSDAFTYKMSDGAFESPAVTVSITINPVNDPPVVGNVNKSANEDNAITFAQTDFSNAYSDPENVAIVKIKITSLPLHGVLKLLGNTIHVSDEIAIADIGDLTFEPDFDWSGSTSFTWNGSDGTDYAVSDATVNISISAVNDAPVVSDFGKSGNEDESIVFSLADFTNGYNDAENDGLASIKITSLPANGVLKLGGVVVNAGDVISASDLGTLTFQPNADWNGNTSFNWLASDGTDFAATSAKVNITVAAVNDAPSIADIYLSALTNAAITFAASDFTGAYNDPENNALAKIKVINLPVNGTLKLSGIAVNAGDEIDISSIGNLTFVPATGWNGAATFHWNGSDGSSYAMNDATVHINISAVPNNAPTVADITKSVTQDNTLIITPGDFTGAFTDVDNNTLVRIKITSLPANGKLKVAGVDVNINDEIDLADIANLTLEPDAGYIGNLSFGWNGFDGTVYAASGAAVNINVTAALNTPPVISNVSLSINEDNFLTFSATDFTAAFTDAENNALVKIKITSLPIHATLKLLGVNVSLNDEILLADIANLTLVPDANWHLPVSFTWNGFDGSVYANTNADVLADINAVNDLPVLSPVAINVATNMEYTFAGSEFTDAFSDVDGDVMVKIKITGLPSHGTLMLNGLPINLNDEIPGSDLNHITYVPEPGWSGTTSFTWNGFDGNSYATSEGTVNITVNPDVTPPVISDVTKTTSEDNILTFSLNDFVNAYSDPDGNGLKKIKITGLPVNGVLKLNGVVVSLSDEISVTDLDKLTFVPNVDWNGTATFMWNGSDGTNYAVSYATFTIHVNAVNDPPVITAPVITQTLDEDSGSAAVDVLSGVTNVDGDVLTISIVTPPAHGIVTVDGSGRLVYTPNANFYGKDTITYQVCDNGTPSLCTTGKVVITVNPVNDPPSLILAQIDETIVNGNPATINIPGNITNVDGDNLTTSVSVQPHHGNVVINGSGEFVYTPDANFVGKDTVEYQVCDDGTPSLCVTGKIVITVTVSVNHAPVVQDGSKATDQDVNVLFTKADFTSKFTDVDNDALAKIRIATLPSHGKLQLSGADITVNQEIALDDLDKIVFVPETGFYGETSFNWDASDGKDFSATSATFNLMITQSDVFVPEGFSPNGDGHNDFFVIKGADQFVVILRIYNRWGNLVYESKHYQNDWDGISNTGLLLSNKLPDGTYFYSINFNNGDKEKIGYITINR